MFKMSYAKTSDFPVLSPPGCKLLPFQIAGVEYCCKVKKVLLSDDMGLGKSPQSIVAMNTLQIKKYIVFCPASLCDNWSREIAKWSLSPFKPHVFNTKKTTPRDCILICSYGVADNFEIINKIIINYRFNGVILDECHYLANPHAQRTKTLLGINGVMDRAECILALSGTPITNKPIDIYVLVNRLNPNALGVSSYKEFGETFAHKFKNPYTHKIEYRGSKNEEELGQRLRSMLMIRRLKKDVLLDLPDKWRRAIYLDPTPEAKELVSQEFALYDSFLAGKKLYQDEENSAFRVRSQLAILKVPSVIEYCRIVLSSVDKICIFGWHREFLTQIIIGLAEYNISVMTGGTPKGVRQGRVDKFQQDPSCRIFVGAITAAGVGITLTASSYVIMGEASWVPGENIQVEDRTYRIGQKNSVQVDYLCFPNSVDERVLKIIGSKATAIKSILDIKEMGC
jgi:SWI/SNF-related matrix-associated actin-dependent regulator 1 of chromatin subfamily A